MAIVSEETKHLTAVWFKCTEPACLMVAQSILLKLSWRAGRELGRQFIHQQQQWQGQKQKQLEKVRWGFEACATIISGGQLLLLLR